MAAVTGRALAAEPVATDAGVLYDGGVTAPVHAPSAASRQPESNRHASLFMPSSAQDLDAVDLGVVLDGGELDGERPVGRGDLGELLHHRLVLAAGGGEYVEVGQHLRPVDGDVEDPRARRCPVLLGEMQPDRVAGPGDGAGDRVAEVTVPVVLVDRLRSGVDHPSG